MTETPEIVISSNSSHAIALKGVKIDRGMAIVSFGVCSLAPYGGIKTNPVFPHPLVDISVPVEVIRDDPPKEGSISNPMFDRCADLGKEVLMGVLREIMNDLESE